MGRIHAPLVVSSSRRLLGQPGGGEIVATLVGPYSLLVSRDATPPARQTVCYFSAIRSNLTTLQRRPAIDPFSASGIHTWFIPSSTHPSFTLQAPRFDLKWNF